MDGITICKHLRKEANDTPILMLTARDLEAHKITGFAAGANDYMIKPFSMRGVESRLLMLALHKYMSTVL